jgi:ABC-type branched-subunit amino acid transport system substrate-binding protein
MLDASPDAYSDPAEYPYIFPVNPSDKAMGVVAAKYIIAHDISRVGVITNGITQATEYVNDVESAVKSLGGSVDFVKDVTFSPTATNVTTQLAQLKAANPDAILISAIYGYGPIYTGLESMGWSPTIIGDVGVPNANPNTLGPLAAKTVAPCWYGIYKGTALPSNIVNVMHLYAPMNTIDAGLLIIADAYLEKILLAKYAIEHSNSTEGPAMKAALEKMTNTPLYWSGMRFTFSPQVHSGLVGAYGAGMCAMTPRASNDNFYYVNSAT